MSKNHPTDNIYSILAKLEALKPTPEETRFALVKEIRESVEAKGSILSGVDAVQAKLQKQFNEAGQRRGMHGEPDLVGIPGPAKGTKPSPKAITKGADREYYKSPGLMGEPERTRWRKKTSETLDGGMGNMGEATLDEVTPPGMEAMVRKLKKEYPGEEGKAYATAWSIYNKKHGKADESREACDECSMHEDGDGVNGDLDMPQGSVTVTSPSGSPVNTDLGSGQIDSSEYIEEAGDLGQQINDLFGQIYDYGSGDDSLEYLDRNAPLWTELFDKHNGDIDAIIANEPDEVLAQAVEELEGVLSDLPYELDEGEITRKPGSTIHTKTDYPGYPSDDLEKDDDDRTGPKSIGGRGRPRKAQTKNPRPVPGAEKKGRGRPANVKTSGPVSMPADPFGRTTGVAPKGKRGTVHTMSEAMDMLGKQLGQLNEGRYLVDESGETLNHILNRFRAEVRNFEQGGDLDKDLYEALVDYWQDAGEIPYRVLKDDPHEWVATNLESHLRGGGIIGGMPDEDYGLEREGIEGNMPPVDNIPGKANLLKTPVTPFEKLKAAGKDMAKGMMGHKDVEHFGTGNPVDEEVAMEDELNELARLAGLHSEGSQVRESFDQAQPAFSLNTSIDSDGKKTVSVNAEGDQAETLLQMLKIAGLGNSAKAQELQHQEPGVEVISVDGDEDCQEIEAEGNEFSGELEKARAQHADTFNVSGHEYEVKEADAPVDSPATQPANAPDTQTSTMRGSTMGPGEGDGGEKAMNPDRPTFKNGDNALSNPPARGKEVLKAVAALESKLAAEYESIKKVSK